MHVGNVLQSKIYKQIQLRKEFDRVADLLGIQQQSDWYSYSGREVIAKSGIPEFLDKYGQSLLKALRSVYSEFEWNPLLFQQVPHGYWKSPENQRRFFDSISEQLGVKKQEDWFRVTNAQVEERGGNGVLHYYNYSLMKALQAAYPEFQWEPPSFPYYLEDPINRRAAMDNVASKLGIQSHEDWYHVTTKQLMKNQGSRVLQMYSFSLEKCLQSVYPEFEWSSFRFQQQPHYYWLLKENQRKYLEWIAEQLHIKHLHEWLTVPSKELEHSKTGYIMRRYGGMVNALKSIYPEYHSVFTSSVKQSSDPQQTLWNALKSLYPKEDIHVEYKLQLPNSNSCLELDFYLPSLQLSFEYQGEQHFRQLARGSFKRQKQRDNKKRKVCKELGIRLIEVPYWWDKNPHSLISTIQKHH